MRRSITAILRLALTAAALLAAPAHAQATNDIELSGAVSRPMTLSVEDLKRLPVTRIDDVRVIAMNGRREERTRRYVGVLLCDSLDEAQLVEAARHDRRRSAVLATASDGYRAVFSWAELYVSPIGEGALVYYERDGQPLDDREGRMALVSLKDTRTGPRHVRWLKSLEVIRLATEQGH